MSCETQTEVGGKDILLKIAGALQAVTGESDTEVFTLVEHGLAVNDLVEFKSLTGGTGLAVDTLYFVKEILTADTFTLSATKGGTLLAFSADLTASTAYLYKSVGGIRSKTFTLNSESIDITNQDSQQWRETLDEAGISSMSVSGSGVFENGAVINQIRADVIARKLRHVAAIVNADYDLFKMCAKIASFELGGEYNGESQYSISLESSGEVEYIAQA